MITITVMIKVMVSAMVTVIEMVTVSIRKLIIKEAMAMRTIKKTCSS
jgi:hypothetical protein